VFGAFPVRGRQDVHPLIEDIEELKKAEVRRQKAEGGIHAWDLDPRVNSSHSIFY